MIRKLASLTLSVLILPALAATAQAGEREYCHNTRPVCAEHVEHCSPRTYCHETVAVEKCYPKTYCHETVAVEKCYPKTYCHETVAVEKCYPKTYCHEVEYCRPVRKCETVVQEVEVKKVVPVIQEVEIKKIVPVVETYVAPVVTQEVVETRVCAPVVKMYNTCSTYHTTCVHPVGCEKTYEHCRR